MNARRFPRCPAHRAPLIYSPVMGLLDEIGADEAAYARNTPKIRRMVNDSDGIYGEVRIPMIEGRDYGYAIDRARFDAALFDHARTFPTVTVRDGFSVIDLLWEGDQVIGIIGQDADKVRQQFTADLVVGADGRFSTIARKVAATERDEHNDYPHQHYLCLLAWRRVAGRVGRSSCAGARAGGAAMAS
ncbi:MAG: hypothetical protein HC828_10800 [Blastochloris sp.]|nr:hypothetical protein [Blastochloris sp.]